MATRFHSAINAHADWLFAFTRHLTSRGATPCPPVADPHSCELGKWIDEHGGGVPTREYLELHAAHVAFHSIAADLAARAKAGEAVGRELARGSRSEFSAASGRVIAAIVAMKRPVGVDSPGRGASPVPAERADER